MKYQIKLASPDNARDIIELDKLFQAEIVRMFSEEMPDFVDIKDREINENDEIEGVKKDIQKGTNHVYLLGLNEKIVGYVTGKIEDRGQGRKIKRTGYIDGIYILEEHRGKGAGKKLMNKILDWFKKEGLQYATLGVSEPNTNAIDFYNYLKFQTIGRDMAIKLR
jgi:ribosomal protein S18 acetylase RimI-like enzyme